MNFTFCEKKKCFEIHLLITLHKIVDLDTSLRRSLVGWPLFVNLSIFLHVHLYSISRFITPNKCNVLTLKTKKKNKEEEKMYRAINDLFPFIICMTFGIPITKMQPHQHYKWHC